MIYVAGYVGMMLLRLARLRPGYGLLLWGLFLFSAFRFAVGCDWFGYLNQFELYGTVPLSEVMATREPAWTAIIAIQTGLGLPYPWLNVITSALFFYGVHRIAQRQPDRLGFLVLLFPVLIINMPMSGIRQGAAIGLMCLAFLAFVDRRLIRFVVLVVLAAGIHSSAAAFLLLAPMVSGGLTRGRMALSALLAIPGGLALLSSDAGVMATTRYVDTGIDAAGAAYRVALLVLTALWFLLFLRRGWAATYPGEYKLVTIGALMMLFLALLLPVSSVIADRLGYYLIPIQAVILARLPFLPLRSGRALAVAAPYLGLLLVLATWALLSSHFQQCYLPYRSWIFGMPEVY